MSTKRFDYQSARPGNFSMVLDIVDTWGWFEWRVLDSDGREWGYSGPQNLRSEQDARDHYAATRGKRYPTELAA